MWKRRQQIFPSHLDDSWMEITPGELDEMLEKASGISSGNSMQSPDSFDLSSVSEGVKAFVEKVSSHEGAEFPG